MPLPLVDLKNICLFIPGQLPRIDVLKHINLQLMPGEHLALTGANGSGKSTLLKLIHGDLWPRIGEISWQLDNKIETSPIVARQLVGIISPHIQAEIQAAGWDVSVVAFLAGGDSPYSYAIRPDESTFSKIGNLLARLESEELMSLRLPQLSQGQLRLALICREILRQTRLLLLDEWNEGLDLKRQELVLRELEECSRKTTMVFASHRRSAIPKWIKRVVHLDNGQIAPASQLAKVDRETIALDKFLFIAKESSLEKPEWDSSVCRPIYELLDVSVSIGGQQILHNITWQMRLGENWQISGPNGSGKSTFLRLLAGDEFVYAGGKLSQWAPKLGREPESLAEKRLCISLVSDLGQSLYGYDLSALELVLSGFDNTVGLYREFTFSEIEWAKQLLESFFGKRVSEIETTSIRRLSSGQLRRLFLVRALINKPDILLLDEPCSGLDSQSRNQFLALLRKLIKGTIASIKPSVVLVTHQQEDVPKWITRRALMREGRLTIAE